MAQRLISVQIERLDQMLKKSIIFIFFIIPFLFVLKYMLRSSANRGESIKIGHTIINALEDYKQKYDHYPEHLEKITPAFLTKIPETANSLHTNFRYHRFIDMNDASEKYKLYFYSGIMDYDQIMYISDQQYHKKKDGSEYAKVDKWIFIHHYEKY